MKIFASFLLVLVSAVILSLSGAVENVDACLVSIQMVEECLGSILTKEELETCTACFEKCETESLNNDELEENGFGNCVAGCPCGHGVCDDLIEATVDECATAVKTGQRQLGPFCQEPGQICWSGVGAKCCFPLECVDSRCSDYPCLPSGRYCNTHGACCSGSCSVGRRPRQKCA